MALLAKNRRGLWAQVTPSPASPQLIRRSDHGTLVA
jgi:hypothetical protein